MRMAFWSFGLALFILIRYNTYTLKPAGQV